MHKNHFALYDKVGPLGRCAMFVLLGVGFGLAGRLDYQDARLDECSAKHLSYNSDSDTCFKEIKNAETKAR